MAGRKTKLNKKLQDRVYEALRGGNTRRVAALVAGIDESTFYAWINRGEAGEAPFAEFLKTVKAAEAEAEEESLLQIKTAARDSWQAAAWYLERKRPDDWGRRDRIDSDVTSKGEKIDNTFNVVIHRASEG